MFRELLVFLVLRGLPALKVLREQQGAQEPLERPVLPVLGLRELRVLKALRGPLERKETRVALARRVLPVQQALLVSKEMRV